MAPNTGGALQVFPYLGKTKFDWSLSSSDEAKATSAAASAGLPSSIDGTESTTAGGDDGRCADGMVCDSSEGRLRLELALGDCCAWVVDCGVNSPTALPPGAAIATGIANDPVRSCGLLSSSGSDSVEADSKFVDDDNDDGKEEEEEEEAMNDDEDDAAGGEGADD